MFIVHLEHSFIHQQCKLSMQRHIKLWKLIREIYLIRLRWIGLEWILLKSLGYAVCFCRFTCITGFFWLLVKCRIYFYYSATDTLMVRNADNYHAILHQNFFCGIIGGGQLSRKSTPMLLLYNVRQPVEKCLIGLLQLCDLPSIVNVLEYIIGKM